MDVKAELSAQSEWPRGGGEMGARMRAYDWASTPLGPMRTWPQSLKTTVDLMLHSAVPMVLLWGEDGVMLYNDAYSIFAGARHPALLGSKVREGWPEVADFNDHVMKVGLAGGVLAYRDQELTLHRSGRPEQVWMDLDYSPVYGETGEPAGVIAIVIETTNRVVAERRRDEADAASVAAQAALSASEEQLRLATEAAEIGLWDLDVLADKLFWPPRVKAMFGISADQPISMEDFREGVHPDDLPSVMGAFEAALDPNRRAVYDVEYRTIGKEDRALRWVAAKGRAFFDASGRCVRVIGTAIDITERKKTETALRESEARFRAMTDAAPQILWITDAEGRAEFFNRQWYDYTGADPRPVMAGEIAASHLHPDDQAETMAKFEDARRTGQTFEVEHRIRGRSGEYRWFLVRGQPVADAATGQIAKIFGASIDIDDLKRAEAALRESEEDYRYAAELNPQVAWTAAADGQLDRVAARWADWTGSSGLGSTYAEGLHQEDVQRTFDVWGRSVATGEPYDIVHRVKRTTGEFRWIRSRAFPRRDAEGRIVRWYGTTEDIHEQKMAEDHLKLMVLELNHRVKNNLATVQAIAVQTLRGTESPLEAREAFLHRITALAAAHDILTREQWEGAGVGEIAHGVLDALSGARERVRLAGPQLRLSPKSALSLSMAFHELGTNALKYGALSRPEGQVELNWSVHPESGDLAVRWSEHGGPPVRQPERRGFGSRLLERGVAAELGGRVELAFEPTGLVCTIEASRVALDAPTPSLAREAAEAAR